MIFNKVTKKPDTIKDEKSLYEQISKTFKSVRVKSIKIVDADFDYINKTAAKKPKTRSNTLILTLTISCWIRFQEAIQRGFTIPKMHHFRLQVINR